MRRVGNDDDRPGWHAVEIGQLRVGFDQGCGRVFARLCIAAFRLNGCGAPVCDPVWSGVNFATGMESSPMVANGVVYIGKGPASGFPVDSGVFMYDARGCGKPLCQAIAFVQTTDQQFYLSSTPAVVDGRLYMGSTETNSNQAGLYVWELP